MDAVTVEEHGAGAEARRVMRVGDVALTAFVGLGDDEPRVSHPDAARRLGFKRERDIVQLIERIWPENQRPYVRCTVQRTQMPTGGVRERAVREYWLAEREFLKLCARSETKIADAILEQMIEVFVRVRRGTMPGLSGEALAGILGRAVSEAVAPIRAELAEVRALAVAQASRPDAGAISRDQADRLLGEFRSIAGLVSGAQPRTNPWLRARTKADNAVRRAVKLANGRAWDSLPAGLYADALARAKELRADAQRAADERRQPELFPKRGAA